MRQQSQNTDGFEKCRKPTRKELFLKDREQIIPWKGLYQVIKLLGGQWVLKECVVFIFFSTGSLYSTLQQKKPYMIPG